MNLLVTLEHRFDATSDGTIWSQTAYQYSFWQQYLEVFDNVRVIARVCSIPSVPSDWKQSSGEQVSFVALPPYVGPWQYLLAAKNVYQTIQGAIGAQDAIIMRVPSQIANTVSPVLEQKAHPYGVIVVGDPYDVFSPGTINHPLRPFFRWWFTRHLRHQCAKACATSYVTQHYLQQHFPPSVKTFTVPFSDVELSEEAFVALPRLIEQKPRFTVIFVGSLAQLYKAPDILLKAVAVCLQQYALDIELEIVGDGQFRLQLEQEAVTLGIDRRIRFLGQLASGEAVRTHLDLADIFVLPSRTEGLPRAMLEAMARGLPCIGSTVGGIPELLPSDDMVPPNDAQVLARKIREILTDSLRMTQMSKRNLAKAKEYHEREFHPRRIAFYQAVRDRTQAWLNQKGLS